MVLLGNSFIRYCHSLESPFIKFGLSSVGFILSFYTFQLKVKIVIFVHTILIMQTLNIKKVSGLNGRGFSLRDEHGNKYWKHQMRRDGYNVRCSLWRSK